jgi:hypothetical protein
MFVTPMLQLECQPDPVRQSVTISKQDRSLLAQLAARDITVRLRCGELLAYDVRVQLLIRHSRYDPHLKAWQFPVKWLEVVHRLPRA